MDPQKKILLVANSKAELNHLLNFSKCIDPGFFSISTFHQEYFPTGEGSPSCPESVKTGALGLMKKVKELFAGNPVVLLFRQYLYFQRQVREVSRVIRERQPDIILLGTDVAYRSLFVKKCCPKRIKVLVSPYSLCNHEEMIFSIQQKGVQKSGTFIERFFFSRWFRRYDNGYFECLSTCPKFIQVLLGVQPPNPWVICGGRSDLVLVPNRFEFDYYEKSGIDAGKLAVYSSRPFNQIPARGGPKDFILWSVPPDHLSNDLFPSHVDMINWHLDFFRHINYPVLISPHPRLQPSLLDPSKFGSNMSMDRSSINDSIERCRVLIASQSATIRYALQKGKPVINFKIYNLPYTEYDQAEPVANVTTKEEFGKAVGDLLLGRNESNSTQSKDSVYFSSTDGGNELNCLLTKLVDHPIGSLE